MTRTMKIVKVPWAQDEEYDCELWQYIIHPLIISGLVSYLFYIASESYHSSTDQSCNEVLQIFWWFPDSTPPPGKILPIESKCLMYVNAQNYKKFSKNLCCSSSIDMQSDMWLPTVEAVFYKCIKTHLTLWVIWMSSVAGRTMNC